MKIKNILFFGLAAAISSCSTAYRSGQTPDDVYYSPAPEQNTYVSTVNKDERDSYGYNNNDEEAAIRRGIQEPLYRTPITLDLGFGYGYSPYYSPYGFNNFGSAYYGYNDYYGFKGLYNPYSGYSYGYNNFGYYSPYSFGYYNPYSFYSSPYYGYNYYPAGRKTINTNRGVRKYNLNVYNLSVRSDNGSVGARGSTIGTTSPTRSPRRTTGVGNVIRRVFTPSSERTYSSGNTNRSYNNSNNNNNNAPVRSFDNSSSPTRSSSSSSGSNSSSTPTRTFRR